MNCAMSINIYKNKLTKLCEVSEFQLHKSQRTIFQGILKKIFDYSEYRLIRYINATNDAQQKLILVALLHDYIDGNIAVAWKRGQLVWIKVIKA